MTFEREEPKDGYVVLKKSDMLRSLGQKDYEDLERILFKINRRREAARKGVLDCLVIEKDWPEYEDTWKLIQDRVIQELQKKCQCLHEDQYEVVNMDYTEIVCKRCGKLDFC